MIQRRFLQWSVIVVGTLTLFVVGSHEVCGDYYSQIMADGPMGYWRFEETGGGTAGDSSGYSKDGTLNGGVALAVDPVPAIGGSAAGFDGSSGFVQLPGAWGGASWAEATIEAWVNTDAFPPPSDFQAIVCTPAGGFAHFQMHDGGSTGFYVSGGVGDGFVSPPPKTPTGVWRHIVLTGKSGDVRVYVDGVVHASTTSTFDYITGSKTGAGDKWGVHIGNGHVGTRWLKGQIDEVAIYNKALSEERILAHYHAVNPGLLTLVETGGTFAPGNLAAASAGATPFAKDEWGYNHIISKLNDESYGNTDSWIGSTDQSFGGVNFGGVKLIDQIAFGRDNLGSFTDRCKGNYTVQYTTAASPNEMTPDGDWNTLSSLEYDASSPSSPAQRHLYQFPSTFATGVRIITDRNEVLGPHLLAIDEIEAYGGHPLALLEAGGTFTTDHANVARRSGATAFAPGVADGGTNPNHQIYQLNDGLYGNSNSWFYQRDSFAGIDLDGLFEIDRIAWGRSNTGSHSDRTEGDYTVQYTLVANPDETTPDGQWTDIGQLTYTDFEDKSLRHLYEFDPVWAMGVRLKFSSANLAICIDEIEVYQKVPEPATWLLAVSGVVGLGAMAALRRRRRRHNH